ncbi:MAG: type II toxin-antitoxin system RelE/ParE family toxin [Chitinophagales bacterium]|nr:type II toxin-antitoxin system RelE/ParE family toxin [Chitinophagales bacterium]
MKYKIAFLKEADEDVLNAVGYYEEQQEGLGIKFKDTLDKKVDYITNYPKHFRIVKKEYRQVLVKSFPYLVIYSIKKDTVLVHRVFNTSRNPKKKYK